MPALAAVLVALLVAWASGGALEPLRNSSVPHPLFIGIVFILQGIARGRLGAGGWGDWGLLVWAVLALVLIVTVIVQWPEPEPLVAVLGISLNLVVVLANGYMPVFVSGESVADPVGAAGAGFYSAGIDASILAPLADVLPLPLLGATYVLSVGDVLLMVGIASLIVRLSTPSPKRDL